MKRISKVIEIPAGTTPAQMETSLNNLLKNGWDLIQVFTFGSKTYAVLQKTISV